MARWADVAGVTLEAIDTGPPAITDGVLRELLAGLASKITHRLGAELYVQTPSGLRVQPLAGAELNQLAAAVEKIAATHRLLDGDAGVIVEHRHAVGVATARLLDRSLAGARARRAIIDTTGTPT